MESIKISSKTKKILQDIKEENKFYGWSDTIFNRNYGWKSYFRTDSKKLKYIDINQQIFIKAHNAMLNAADKTWNEEQPYTEEKHRYYKESQKEVAKEIIRRSWVIDER